MDDLHKMSMEDLLQLQKDIKDAIEKRWIPRVYVVTTGGGYVWGAYRSHDGARNAARTIEDINNPEIWEVELE